MDQLERSPRVPLSIGLLLLAGLTPYSDGSCSLFSITPSRPRASARPAGKTQSMRGREGPAHRWHPIPEPGVGRGEPRRPPHLKVIPLKPVGRVVIPPGGRARDGIRDRRGRISVQARRSGAIGEQKRPGICRSRIPPQVSTVRVVHQHLSAGECDRPTVVGADVPPRCKIGGGWRSRCAPECRSADERVGVSVGRRRTAGKHIFLLQRPRTRSRTPEPRAQPGAVMLSPRRNIVHYHGPVVLDAPRRAETKHVYGRFFRRSSGYGMTFRNERINPRNTNVHLDGLPDPTKVAQRSHRTSRHHRRGKSGEKDRDQEGDHRHNRQQFNQRESRRAAQRAGGSGMAGIRNRIAAPATSAAIAIRDRQNTGSRNSASPVWCRYTVRSNGTHSLLLGSHLYVRPS